MRERRNEISLYLENLALLILGIFCVSFPLVFSTATTDAFNLPKQILLAGTVLISLLFMGVKMISEGSVKIRRTPFDFPIIAFGIITLLSVAFAINRADAIISYIPFLFALLSYFLLVHFVKKQSSLFFIVVAIVAGTTAASLLVSLSFFKLYILPFAFTKVQTFTTIGTLLDQAMYFAIVLPISAFLALPIIKVQSIEDIKNNQIAKTVGFLIASIIIIVGLSITTYQLFTTQKPLLLPFETGFQTAFAAISQDTGRVGQGFFLGSGFGTYVTDFTRFKLATFNQNPSLWSLTFLRSSSFVLELLATVGTLGLLTFILLIIKIVRESKKANVLQENPLYVSLLVIIIAGFILPFSFIIQTLFFVLLGIFAAAQSVFFNSERDNRYFDVELYFVAFKKGLFPISSSPASETAEEKRISKLLPVSFFITFLLITTGLGYYVLNYVRSDMLFQNSLIAASQNNGLQTYNDQTNAISVFPYRDAYYRIYSQTNLALANSLASQAKGSTISAQTQQTIYTLIQQSINAARQATTISPLTSVNWQNLSSIYRSLIGFGQNAESFSVLANQQAILLDPNNPQQYVNIGGIYYQLGQWDNAINQFQIASNLKPDFANAHYNLGHALEQKGDLKNALSQYQAVKTLVANDPENSKKITEEISSLEQKIGREQKQAEQQAQKPEEKPVTQNKTQQPPLKIETPKAQLPGQQPQVAIPAPLPATSSSR